MAPAPNSELISMGGSSTGGILPYLALVASQLITSSWHVLGKHVMHQVPFLTPIAFILPRTGFTAVLLLTLGRIYEGHVSFPPLFCINGNTADGTLCHDDLDDGFVEEKKSASSLELAENGSSDSVLTKRILNGSDTTNVINGHGSSRDDTTVQKRRRRKMTSAVSAKGQLNLLREFIVNTMTSQQHTKSSTNRQNIISINPEVIQIVSASMAGMLLLPLCYTTGLILTNPTVASVWDGPMIPLSVFCTAVTLGVETLSRKRPIGQICSLLLTVGGSVVVLLIDFYGSHNKVADEAGEIIGHANHWEFIRGNIVLMGIIGAYSAMSLLQKQLTHYPPVTLTRWMMAFGFVGCCCLLVMDSMLETLRGTTITGCNFGQAISQFTTAWVSSPTFRYGMVYASLFVGRACFSIMSYASLHLDASIITLFAAIQPPITAVMERN